LGAQNHEISALPDNDGPWLAGRAAKVCVNGIHIGCFGEIDPNVAEQFELKVPLNGAEFSVDQILLAIPDPV
jgi:phenylalanyl-tRNA synthetase beta subunit